MTRCDGHRDRFVCHNEAVHDVEIGAHPRTGELFYDHYCQECYDFLYKDSREKKACPVCGREHPVDEFQFVEEQELCPECRAERYLAKAAPAESSEEHDIEHVAEEDEDDDDEEADDVDVDNDSE